MKNSLPIIASVTVYKLTVLYIICVGVCVYDFYRYPRETYLSDSCVCVCVRILYYMYVYYIVDVVDGIDFFFSGELQLHIIYSCVERAAAAE